MCQPAGPQGLLYVQLQLASRGLMVMQLYFSWVTDLFCQFQSGAFVFARPKG